MRNPWLAVLTIALCPAILFAQDHAATQNDRQVLQEILQQTYQPSLIGKQMMGLGKETDIRRAGTIVVIQRPGLFGSLQHNEPASSAITGLRAELFRGDKDYEVPVGERYYVTAVAVSSSTILVGLLSARSIPTQKGAGRVWTSLSFNFPDQVLATADKETVFREIDQWFVPEGRGVAAAPAVMQAPSSAPASTPVPAKAPASIPPVSATSATPQQAPAPLAAPVSQGTSRVKIQSDPAGAEIYLDGQMVGSTPSVLQIPTGTHLFRVHADGHADWSRQVNILPGSEITLSATLTKN
ncbi:MAG TPA: PEGA domain-containing protein [Candidatus Eisenbacteria bacterium]|nr:PEGA domain-containing protein [Candidatus Eisenbacteria bacterium]